MEGTPHVGMAPARNRAPEPPMADSSGGTPGQKIRVPQPPPIAIRLRKDTIKQKRSAFGQEDGSDLLLDEEAKTICSRLGFCQNRP